MSKHWPPLAGRLAADKICPSSHAPRSAFGNACHLPHARLPFPAGSSITGNRSRTLSIPFHDLDTSLANTIIITPTTPTTPSSSSSYFVLPYVSHWEFKSRVWLKKVPVHSKITRILHSRRRGIELNMWLI
ncbi:hypothetical protein BaRGS_00010141 [Batillaria attramentaria]|uniref:Uncharacterized protein n=1 Tax=Batillaria attramentaria TaxID=370345 RepID=A0ABD0LGZ3_9CAEN